MIQPYLVLVRGNSTRLSQYVYDSIKNQTELKLV